MKYRKGLAKDREECTAECLDEGEGIKAQKWRAKVKAEKIESASKMLSKGLEIQDIADFTGLSNVEL